MGLYAHPADQNRYAYFGFSQRRDFYHTSDQSSSTDISPGSLPTHPERHTPRPGRPSFHVRSRSDQPIRQRKINFLPVSHHVPTVHQNSAPASFASSILSLAGPVRKAPNLAPSSSTLDRVQGGSTAAKPARPGTAWKRTHSGGVWIIRPASGTRREIQQSSDSPTSTLHVVRSGREAVSPPPKPLRPPLSRSDGTIGSGYRREVKLETSFTASIAAPTEPHTPPRRRLSLNPKQIFSSTVLLARRFSLRGRSSKAPRDVVELPLEHSSQNLSPIHNLTHSTALRPNKTLSVLQRVTSILSEAKSLDSPPHMDVPKAIRIKSTLPAISAATDVRAAPGALEAAGATMVRTPPVSYTSSQRELRLGAAPTGTPEDNATYKVGDEVFFKVDISIRGGTSYLPSEARRIHTPPLPGEDVHAPSPVGPDGHRCVPPTPRGDEEATATNTPRPPPPPPPRPVLHRARTRDWYEVQLQLLEAEAHPAHCHGVAVDYDIPEHLPTSPLCPRNARYWRYVLGQFPKGGEGLHRICWMHGMKDG